MLIQTCHHFIGWSKHAWQDYVVLDGKYGWRGYQCNQNRTLGENPNFETLGCKIKNP